MAKKITTCPVCGSGAIKRKIIKNPKDVSKGTWATAAGLGTLATIITGPIGIAAAAAGTLIDTDRFYCPNCEGEIVIIDDNILLEKLGGKSVRDGFDFEKGHENVDYIVLNESEFTWNQKEKSLSGSKFTFGSY
ncbi:MAG: hypothetical protein IJ644_07590 [Oscillospiraceae bacterium]|nr:hypothetical protein [Oscillospiraceae bacterium]